MTTGSLTSGRNPLMMRKLTTLSVGTALTALASVLGGAVALKAAPWLQMELFARGAARLAGLFTGVPAVRVDEGWMLPLAGQPVVVTAACSATDFFLMTAALLAWHGARHVRGPALFPVAAAGALLVAVPVTIGINALRIIAVAQMHRWVIPQMPAAYDAFLHMLTGVAVFLPALIALNLLLELHGRLHSPSAHA